MPDPTYRQMGDHTEVVRVSFDVNRISFEQLLHVFWNHHSGKRHGYGGTQYQSMLMTECLEHVQIAEGVIQRYNELESRGIETVIKMDGAFTSAEMYHQKYILRKRSRTWNELLEQFESEQACIRSTFTARLNALAGGHLSKQELVNMLEQSADFAGDRKRYLSILNRMKW